MPQVFDKAWSVLKATYDELLDSYSQHPYYNHPENTSYRELMEYLEEIKGQEITPEIDDDRRFNAKMALEHAEHLDGLFQGLHDDDGNPLGGER